MFRILESKSYNNVMSHVIHKLLVTLEDITPPEEDLKILEIDMEPQNVINIEVFDLYSMGEKIMGPIYIHI